MNNKFDEFKALKTDVERWQWLVENQDHNLAVLLDNDDTFLVDNDSEDNYARFDNFVGDSTGVLDLLKALGIKAERV